MKDREEQLRSWVSKQLGSDVTFSPVKGDASFRRYYRVKYKNLPYIAVDTPPDTENNDAFVAISTIFERQGLIVPEILSFQQQDGFMLLSDLGETLLIDMLHDDDAQEWYRRSFLTLRLIQACPVQVYDSFPPFNQAFITKECQIFDEWCLEKLLALKLSPKEKAMMGNLYKQFFNIFSQQPQVVTHRDFHARNLMISRTGDIGVIDFQDAMLAPITYDIVSMLKDCYIAWPVDKRLSWLKMYFDMLQEEQAIECSFEDFIVWFDWVGLQRHLKVLGVFSRLKIRDHKESYLADTPRIMNYIKEILPHNPALAEFECFFDEKMAPAFEAVWEKEGIEQVA